MLLVGKTIYLSVKGLSTEFKCTLEIPCLGLSHEKAAFVAFEDLSLIDRLQTTSDKAALPSDNNAGCPLPCVAQSC